MRTFHRDARLVEMWSMYLALGCACSLGVAGEEHQQGSGGAGSNTAFSFLLIWSAFTGASR